MKLKKRSGRSRIRGTRTCGWAMKKHKGSGNRGGKGMAGTGKRADQRKTQLLGDLYPYFGRRGFTSKPTERKKNDVMNLREIADKFKEKEIKLEGYKILGEGTGFKATIHAESASKSAVEKMEKAGGKIIIKVMNKKPEVKKANDKKQ
jgi:large subunit ribosomal protein L15